MGSVELILRTLDQADWFLDHVHGSGLRTYLPFSELLRKL
jgi:hypothetical protein